MISKVNLNVFSQAAKSNNLAELKNCCKTLIDFLKADGYYRVRYGYSSLTNLDEIQESFNNLEIVPKYYRYLLRVL